MSRRLFVSLVFGLFCLPVFGEVMNSYEDAVEAAKTEGKDVYVLFGGEDCPWCVKQKAVLQDSEVGESLSDFVVVHVDISSRRDLVARHRIRSIPVSMVVDADESVKKKAVGYMDKVKFLNWIR